MKPAAALIAVFAAIYWQIVAETVDRGPPEPWRPGASAGDCATGCKRIAP